MKSFKGNISAAIERQWAEYRKSDAFLQDNIEFDTYARLPLNQKHIIEQLFKELISTQSGFRKYEQKHIDLEILIANLLKSKAVSVSYNSKAWRQTRYNKASRFTLELISMLEAQNYIERRRGYHFPHEARLTRIIATDKLLEYCPVLPSCVVSEPLELVELRDSNSKLKEYKDTAETERIRKILKRVNKVNSEADIRYKRYKLNAFLVAIFREKFTLYGRLHTRGFRHYQGYSGEEREKITINGVPVVEWDFSGLHPNLLYASIGKQYEGDPYAIVDDRPEARPFLKHILLCMLNSENETWAERGANSWLRNDENKEQLHKIGIYRAKPLMDAFRQAHKPIADYFCNGKESGMRLMNKDAKIALDIVNHFANQGIPILAIHDSFIVQEQYSDELYRVMGETYKKHTGFSIKIK